MEKKPKRISIDLTPLVLIALVGLAIFWGGLQVAWALVWVYAFIVVLAALAVSVLTILDTVSDPSGLRIKKETVAGESTLRKRLALALWPAASMLAFGYLVWQGHPLMAVPLVSLLVFVIPDTTELIADEYVRHVLAKASSLAGALALAVGLLTSAVLQPPAIELLVVMLAVYVLVLEWAAYRELR